MTHRARFETAAAGVAVFGLFFAGWLLVWAVAPLTIGWTSYLVDSDSMSPAIRAGDIVVARPTKDTPGLEVGQVVIVGAGRSDLPPLIHRIYALTSEGQAVTKGDANPRPDSALIRPADVVATPVLRVPLIGLPAHWYRHRDTVNLTLLAVALALVVTAAARVPSPPRSGRGRRPLLGSSHAISSGAGGWRPVGAGHTVHLSGHRPRPMPAGLRRLVAAATFGGGLIATTLVIGPVLAAFAATTANSSNLVSAASAFPLTLYLHDNPTPPTGNQASEAILPLDTSAPTATTLYNYDTDRDSSPGLFLPKTGGLAETDPAKIQRWSLTTTQPFAINGNAALTVYSVIKDYRTDKGGAILAGLYDCNTSHASCTTIATGTATSNPWSPTGTWAPHNLDFGSVSYTLATGRTLVVKLVVGPASEDHMWFAYDTTQYRSKLTVTP